MHHRIINAIGPYDFAASVRFLEEFTPAAYEGSGIQDLTLAFPGDDAFRPAAVHIVPVTDGVSVQITGDADPDMVQAQVARILSLDEDGRGWPGVVEHDPVLDRIAGRIGLLRPVLFASPYEAACWAIIGNRIRTTQAARIKATMAAEIGTALEIAGRRLHAFPGPEALLALEAFPGLTPRKIDYLHGIARAALDGHLSPGSLRSKEPEAALGHLQEVKGIGPFGAELVLIRGAGTVDLAPRAEPRLARAIALAYDVSEANGDRLREIIDSWAPFRTWATVLLRANLETGMRRAGEPAVTLPAAGPGDGVPSR